MLLHFLLKCAHTFYPENGLPELLEKLEFSKGTEWLRSEGLRISFINHYEVKIDRETTSKGYSGINQNAVRSSYSDSKSN